MFEKDNIIKLLSEYDILKKELGRIMDLVMSERSYIIDIKLSNDIFDVFYYGYSDGGYFRCKKIPFFLLGETKENIKKHFKI